jgi:hypothetical protein
MKIQTLDADWCSDDSLGTALELILKGRPRGGFSLRAQGT